MVQEEVKPICINNYLNTSLNRYSTGSANLLLKKKYSKEDKRTPCTQNKKLTNSFSSSQSDETSPKPKKMVKPHHSKKVEQIKENSSTENLKESLRVRKSVEKQISGFLQN